MKMKIRSFSEAGISEFKRRIDILRNGGENLIDNEFLLQKKYSKNVSKEFVELKDFHNKQDFAKYIHNKVNKLDLDNIYFDRGLWSWLGAFYLTKITKSKNNRQIVKRSEFYILDKPKEYRTYYRHLVLTPVRAYHILGNDADIYYDVPLHVHGEIAEQILSNQRYATSKNFISAFKKLFFEIESKKFKPGTKGKSGVRRFVAVAQQLYFTYNLETMNPDSILKLYPSEFNKWK